MQHASDDLDRLMDVVSVDICDWDGTHCIEWDADSTEPIEVWNEFLELVQFYRNNADFSAWSGPEEIDILDNLIEEIKEHKP
jgi:hypothetical protein